MSENNPFDFADAESDVPRYGHHPHARRRRGRSAVMGWTMFSLMLVALVFLLCIPLVPALLYLTGLIGGVVWVAVDSRGEPAAPAWIIVVLLAGPLGLLVYLVQRQP